MGILEEIYKKNELLLERIKANMASFENLLNKFSDEEMPYRFYHQSFKVERMEPLLKEVMEAFKIVAEDDFDINLWYKNIHEDGLIGPFRNHHNRDWLFFNRPRLEAWFHTRYFLENIVKYGNLLDKAPEILPEGWASVLYLFNVR